MVYGLIRLRGLILKPFTFQPHDGRLIGVAAPVCQKSGLRTYGVLKSLYKCFSAFGRIITVWGSQDR